MDYQEFVRLKSQLGGSHGFKPVFMPNCMLDFQYHLTEWAILKGRGGLFSDCGTGKTLMQLTWGENVVRYTNKPVLVLTPLAVGAQTVREGAKFGIEAVQSRDGRIPTGARQIVTNYERLHLFDPNDFAGCVCDESGILKNFRGDYKQEITDFMRKLKYRLLTSATPAPNDFIELGTSSEALGYLGYMDMLNRFFKNDLNNSATGRMRGEVIKWRLKGHAEVPFWRWVASFSRAMRKPSDLGFDDRDMILPALEQREHVVQARQLAEGMLFALPAVGMKEQREERRRTVEERCETAANLVNHTGQPAIVWCHLNPEGDLLERLIPDAVQVSGKDHDDKKEEKLMAFADGKARVLVTKPSIGAWGLNFQHCNHMTFFPSHSYEQFYQGVRRCWRFGQKRPVMVDIVTTEGEGRVMKNLQRKSEQADQMFSRMIQHMNDALHIDRVNNNYTTKMEVPPWLSQIR